MDAPSCEEAREYECVVLDETSEEEIFPREQLTELKTRLDQEAANAICPYRLRKPCWALSAGDNKPSGSSNEEEKAEESKNGPSNCWMPNGGARSTTTTDMGRQSHA